MRAFVMKEIGAVGRMDKPVPTPRPNDAVVKTTAALICTSDSHTVSGGIGPRTDLTLGHEAVGVVAPDDVTAHGASPVSFDELIEHSDYLVIQAPLTPQTHHLIGEVELRRMKPTLVLVNTARGPIVDDAALHRALEERWIAGAGLDDIEEEPAEQQDWRPENPLFGLDNVIITPHAANDSEESIRTVRDFAAREVVRVLTGQPPQSPVNAT